jgi:GDP-L-fucose synthase
MTVPYELTGSQILITGGGGFLGRHLRARLLARGVSDSAIAAPARAERDLLRFEDCRAACAGRDVVFHLAARVGGIAFNLREPARIFYENSVINAQVLEAARLEGVTRLIATGSVCAYPKETPVPTREEHLYAGPPEESNLAYGLTKRMLHAQVAAYRAQHNASWIYVLPANLYGPGDNFDPEDSHVIPGLIRRFSEAAEAGAVSVSAWGDGLSTREFLYAADCAEAMARAAERYDDDAPLNLSADREIRVGDLATLIAGLCGYQGAIEWDASRPSGQRRRHYDASRSVGILGSYATTTLEAGLAETVRWYRECIAAHAPRSGGARP